MEEFKESLSTAVFTTRYVVDSGSPILFVFHDDDGSWQFHGREDNVSDEDVRIVGLGEIIDIDKTILELSNLPEGFEAARSHGSGSWNILSSN